MSPRKPEPSMAEIHRAEQCRSLHEAIAGLRTGLLPINHRRREDGEYVDVYLCPRCGLEIEAVVPPGSPEL